MITVDAEFEKLIPPLSIEEYKQLEENCVKEGIREPLIVWHTPGNDILIDGHNRFRIAAKHSLKCEFRKMNFKNRNDAMIWMIKNQLGRRNVSAYYRSILAMKLKPAIEKQAKENQKRTAENRVSQISAEQKIDTREEIAKIAGVSHDTIHKVEIIEKDGDKKLIDQVKRGEKTINRAYQEVRAKDTPVVESRAQREARELREAKKRHEEFEQAKAEKVVSLADAAQDKEDMAEIADAFYEDFIKIGAKMLFVDNMIADGSMRETLRGMKRGEMSDLMNRARNYMGIMVRFQRILAEVADEK